MWENNWNTYSASHRLEATGINCVSKKAANGGHLKNKNATIPELSLDGGEERAPMAAFA